MKRGGSKKAAAPEKRHWMRLTYACNNRCLFCLDGDQNQRGEPRPFTELSKELRRAYRGGMRRVVLSGGEPTLHPRFIDVVREATRVGFTHAQVITNGRRFCYPGDRKGFPHPDQYRRQFRRGQGIADSKARNPVQFAEGA